MTAQRIDGSVIRQNVCHPDAPSVCAACSCSSPISRSVGITSRATYGTDTNTVASTIAGSANRICVPCAWNHGPNQPVRPYSRNSDRPTTTGESASGRSTNAFTSPLPGKRRRTIARPTTIPKIVFSGTAIAAISIVSLNACSVSASVIADHALPIPSAQIRQKSIDSGPSKTTVKYDSAIVLRTFMPRGESAEAADAEQDEERDREQQHGERGRTGAVAALRLVEDPHRRELGAERPVAGDDHDRPDLADRTRECHRDAGEDPRQ